jgi:hypothetical protein
LKDLVKLIVGIYDEGRRLRCSANDYISFRLVCQTRIWFRPEGFVTDDPKNVNSMGFILKQKICLKPGLARSGETGGSIIGTGTLAPSSIFNRVLAMNYN